jgi:amino acid adenylation domain-containing protein/FkbH-like protein
VSGLVNPIDREQLSPLKRAVFALERMQAKLDQYEHPSRQVEDPSVAYHSLLALEDQPVLDRLNGFISDHEQLSPLKRAVVALERMQERLTRLPLSCAENQAGLEDPGALALDSSDIAIIGMAGRFPGARDIDEFWRNLQEGKESVSFFTQEELIAAGVEPGLLSDERYVPAGALLEEVEWFDASFFGYTPREAEIIDPQQRIFLECAWQALEDAGYNPESYQGRIAVFGGATSSTYLTSNLLSNPALAGVVDQYQMMLGNSTDFLTSRVSYKLNLRGLGVTVLTACSTSLVAVHLACESLRTGKCDMALAGGGSVRFPQKAGYFYQEGGIMSPDGHCRAFDADSKGIVGGEGVGLVVVKRLTDALADGDAIRAVIRGSAINNDGAQKVGYTAPGVQGQASVIAEALAMSGIDPQTVRYIEAHGTGTPLGDPIEVAALQQVYGSHLSAGQCALGSVKSNIGHLDAAAGVAGLIKTVEALQHRMLPPSLHVVTPNPGLDLEHSAFYINTALSPWEANGTPRRAGVSSFGIGGTNAHVVLEEAPVPEKAVTSTHPWHLLVLSARTATALQQARVNLLQHLQQHPELELADVAYTLQVGRKPFAHRSMLVCRDLPDALQVLSAADATRLLSTTDEINSRPVVFLFPGQGTQYSGMGRELYHTETVFRAEIDRCAEILLPYLDLDLRSVLYPNETEAEQSRLQLSQTWLAQSALFVVEYALAQLWLSWGITPGAMIGHSIGEYVAACLAEVFPLETALKLVVLRGRLMQQLPQGAMLAVSLPLAEIRPLLSERLSLAAINTPEQCVVAGPQEDIEQLTQLISEQGAFYSRLHTSHAFHSLMVEPIIEIFVAKVGQLPLRPPRLPYISNVSGTWISEAQATDPTYWGQHLRQTVRFADGVSTLLQETDWIFLEVGPGRTLGTFVKQQRVGVGMQAREPLVAASLPHAKSAQASDYAFILTALGRLWLGKVPIQWRKLPARRRVHLPTYPFERQRYWIERPLVPVAHPLHPLPHHNGRPTSQQEALEAVEQPLAPRVATVEHVPQNAASSLHARPHLPVAYRAPRNELEQRIANTWQQLFGISRIGIDDPFFDLGGDSLLAVQILSQLRTLLHIDLTLHDLFETGTVAGVVQRVETLLQARVSAQEKTPAPLPSIADAPLSFTQRRLWFLDRLEPGNPVLNISLAIRVQGPLDLARMDRCFQEIIRRQAALRTHFVEVDGEPVQRIVPSLRLPLPLIDLHGLPAHKRENALECLIAEEARRPFDLSQAPLIRTTVLRLNLPEYAHHRQEEHVLLLSMHHAVSDGWSMGVFLNEFSACYAAFTHGQPSPLPALTMQYVDFAAWQRAQEAELEEHLHYWRTKLGDDLPVLDLPTDYPRPTIPAYRGARQRLQLPGALLRDLKLLSQRARVTFFMVLLGAFQVLLSRYSGQEDILVSTPLANRNRNDAELIIGPFIDKLVLRTDLSGDPTFHDLLGRVREVCLQAYAHQGVPFDTLVEVLNPQRDTSRAPLTQVVLRLPNVPMAPIAVADLTVSILPVNVETADQDLTLDMIELPDGVEAAVEYHTALFAPATIERLLRHWQVLLEAVVANPQAHLSQLSLLTPAESRTILSEWNSTWIASLDNRAQLFVHELFEQQAGQIPDAIAVSLEYAQLSYGELNQRANQLARYLQMQGVGPEVLVGVCMERSLEMIVGMLSVLKAGGAYVPLDPAYPEERLAFMLEDAQISILLLQDQSRHALPAHRACLEIMLDSDWLRISSLNGENLVQTGDISNLAYVIYTSGSTGQPKGVLVSHSGIVNLVEVQTHTFGVQSADHVLQFASTSFDAAISELFMTLCMGARLCLAWTENLQPGQTLVDLLCAQHISLITLPPSALTVMEPEAVPDLRTIVVAGESCPADVMQRWVKGRRFFNAYGPTEGTVCATIAACSEQMTGRPPIGHPISHTQAYILDAHLGLVPVGVVGQLHIGGRGLARGYLNRPDLTADRFLPHPFGAEPGMCLYKTGDRARYLPDGTIEFLGRVDQQVKVRGYRIELGEIEAVLGQHPAVRECAVVVQEEQWEDKRLIAYVVGRDDTPDSAELRQHLKRHLPEYMLPGMFIPLEALPLSTNGKIDRRALLALQHVADVVEDDYKAPRTMVEELIIDIFVDILQLEWVSMQDNFFDIGGHSLLGAQIISRIRLALGIEVPIYNLFEAETIGKFCAFVEAAFRSKQGVGLPPLVPTERRERLPLSFAQQRMWFLDQLQPGNAFYTIVAPFRVSGPLHVAALEQSLQEMVRRHEVLRTVFVMLEEEPCQIIASSFHLPLPLVDLNGLSKDVRRAELRRQVALEAQQPFHLARGPLLRAWLFRMEAQEHVLLLTLHTSISDGWSRGIVMRELTALYQAFRAGENHHLPALPVQYADFALWQRQWLQGEALATQTSYWLQHLASAPTRLELPTDRPRPAIQTYRGGHQAVFVPGSVTQALKDLSQREGCTLFMTMLAAFLVLLSRYSGQEDIVIGTPVAGRNLGELEDLIGFFANTLALRTDLSGNPTFLELSQRVREVALGGYTHQDLPFEKLVEIVQPERNLSHSPLFQVMFTLQDALSLTRESTWLAPAELEIETETAKFDLSLFLSNGVHGLEGVIEYNTDLFDSATITSLLRHWSILLEGIISNPHERLASLPLLTTEEHQLLLNKLANNRTKAAPRLQRQIAITATFTADPLEESLLWWLGELNWPAKICFAPYQQLFQQLLDGDSLLQSNHYGINVLLVRFEDWLRIKADTPDARVAIECLPDSSAKVERNVRDLSQAVQRAAQCHSVPYLLCVCPPSPALLSNEVLQKLFQRMEHLLSTELRSSDGVYVLTSTELADMYPLDVSYDPVGDEIGHVPFTPAFFASLGTMIIRKVAALYRHPYKVIAVDCDNTLWKGVCGEGGAMGVELSAPYLALQHFLVAQQEAGRLICLCSKNNVSDVLEVFAKRHEMPLQLKHLVAMRINWQAKSQNLLALAQELQLGIDSFVFIDDNPLECAEVQQYCPQVFTLPLPSDATQWSEFLKHTWIFDHLRLTKEDRIRTELYQQNRARSLLLQEAPTLKEFLAGLELEVHISPIAEQQLARVAQLTQRTNQFNCTTRRRSTNEITHYLSEPGQKGLVVEVRDRFGDYGKVGVMLFALRDETLTVDTFLMSCRSMGRGVEHRMLAHLGVRAQEMGMQRVLVPYLPSGKNKPVLDFLEQVGAVYKQAGANGEWSFDFPAASLVDLSYSPPDEPSVPYAEDEGMEPVTDGTSRAGQTTNVVDTYGVMRLTPQNILRIAHELPSIELVLQTISSWKKQSVGPPSPLKVAQTRTEIQLVEMWQQLLHLEQVSANDSFFGLGGHSLLATQLLSRIAMVFGIRLPLQVIFERPTIVQLAEQIDAVLRAEGRDRVSLPSIRRVASDGTVPLSFAQQRLWFLDQLAPGNSSYNIPLRIRLQGTLDIAALQSSLQEIVQRHAVLRTTFSVGGDGVLQVIAPVLILSLPIIDLQQLPPVAREREAQQLLKEEWQAIFSLEHGPLLRMMVLRSDMEDAILAITLHHIVFDAWSAGVLSRELVVLYTAFRDKQPSPLTPLPIQYADFALWQREWLQGDVLQKLEAYWRERLRGAAALRLPGELPATTRHSFQGEHIPFALSSDLSRRLMVLSQQEDVTLFMTLLAAFQTLLYRSTGQTDIVLGTDIANRTLSETEQLIGFFVNLLVLRTDLSDQPTFRELLQRVREGVLEAYAHQDLPFEQLVDAAQMDRKLNHAPLVRVLFVLQNTPMVPITLPDLTISPVEMAVDTVNFDLVVFMYEEPQGLQGILHYSADAFDSRAIEHLLEHFLTLLADIPIHCDASVDTLAIYSKAEQEQLLLEDTAREEERRRKLKIYRQKGNLLPDQTSL